MPGPRLPLAGQPSAGLWPAAGVASAILLGAIGLAVWARRERRDDGGSADEERDDDGRWGGDGPRRPQRPTGPHGTGVDWSVFDLEFERYVGSQQLPASHVPAHR